MRLWNNNTIIISLRYNVNITFLSEKQIETENNVFTINRLEVDDVGNYTCTKTSKDGIVEKYEHQLEIIAFPIYKVKLDICYAINDSCSLPNGDILYAYLPKIFDVLLCGHSLKICTVNIDRPKCFTKVRQCNIMN